MRKMLRCFPSFGFSPPEMRARPCSNTGKGLGRCCVPLCRPKVRSQPIHNNLSELHLRRQAVGRKAWLFVGSQDGARVNTTFVSLLASCAMHRLEPWAYLRDLFCLLPGWPIKQVLDLAPVNWQAALQQPTVQATLVANIQYLSQRHPHPDHQRAVA